MYLKLMLIGLFLWTGNCFAQKKLTGKVVKVLDGDTFDLLNDNNTIFRVRLLHIDAPEKSQDFGKVSKNNLASYIAGQNVIVEYEKLDRNKRILGMVFVGNKAINMLQVLDGYAWHFKKYSSDQRFAQAENVARREKRGLWIQANPTPPWFYRKTKHPKP